MFKLNLTSSYRQLTIHYLKNRYFKPFGGQKKNQVSNYCSSVVKKSPNDFEVKESEDLNFNYQDLNLPKDLEMRKLIDLNLKGKLDPISKPGSFTVDLFLGKIDTDFLFYPKIITTPKENTDLHTQSAIIDRNFRDTICKEDGLAKLKEFGFFNIWNLSMTEKCTIFESIGSSMSKDFLFEQLLNSNSKDLQNSDIMKILDTDYKNKFLKLLFNNLSGSCLTFAGEKKEIVKKYKELIANGAKVGFAFNETEKKLGSLPFSDWLTVAELSNDKKSWILKGEKNKIFNDNYDHYIIFARTNDYPEDEKSTYKRKYEEPYDGIVCFLIDKKDLEISDDEVNNLENNEFKYQKIEMDYIKVPRENELFEAEEYGCFALSCRGIGLLMTSSYQLGILKSLQRQVYKFLIHNKGEFLNCKGVQGTLVSMTEIIYTIESMVYLIAAMYDSFEIKNFPDMTLETSILKSFTTEESRQFLVKLQTLFGSKLMDVSKLHNVVNFYDSLFDSAMHHSLFTASMGSHFVGVYNVNDIIKYNLPVVYPTFQLWKKIKLSRNELDKPILEQDVSGHLHVKLAEEGNYLEYCLKRLEYGAYLGLEKWKKEINEQQMHLLLISDAVTQVFTLTCVLARASRSEIEGVWNSDYEIYLARNLTRQKLHKTKFLIEKIEEFATSFDEDMYDNQIHKKNLKFNGYFPYSPIDITY